ncbi:hypothetical protein HJG60_008480 [Phyllostomus discolor]|uniref:Uncharacterized protein n=1 Tax=Phyllostomus discolor TaxID=89673 RepID=A0A833Z4Q9_9CHIR|nr:hypothetical protein HJG60_008480 [Phyllostomus discolor]
MKRSCLIKHFQFSAVFPGGPPKWCNVGVLKFSSMNPKWLMHKNWWVYNLECEKNIYISILMAFQWQRSNFFYYERWQPTSVSVRDFVINGSHGLHVTGRQLQTFCKITHVLWDFELAGAVRQLLVICAL